MRVHLFSEESWENPPRVHTCSLVPSISENKPSNTLQKATGEANTKPAASTSTLKLGRGCRISELNFELGVLVGGEVLLN